MRNYSAVLAVLFAIGVSASPVASQTFTTLDVPGATNTTYAYGICGNNIVGTYWDSTGNPHGFLYTGSTYTTIDDPLSVGQSNGNVAFSSARNTKALGISGANIVGFYNNNRTLADYGFLYNGSTYTTLSEPLGTNGTDADGVSGSEVVGRYYDSLWNCHGFLYDINSSTYTTLDDPLAATGTVANGVDGGNIVGGYSDSSWNCHGFLYNISTSTYTTLDDPLGTDGTLPRGVSGDNIVGTYVDPSGNVHGFLYNISSSTYTTLDDPLGTDGTLPCGVSGSNIVGYYLDASGAHGFEASVPEPSTLVLLGVGAVALIGCRWRQRRAT